MKLEARRRDIWDTMEIGVGLGCLLVVFPPAFVIVVVLWAWDEAKSMFHNSEVQ